MKQITNWKQASIADFEADGLLDTVTKMHVMSYQIREMNGDLSKVFTIRRDHKNYKERVAKFFQYHIDRGIPVVMHNGIGYDVRMVEEILEIDLSGLMVVDTLALSWYLSPDRHQHGLDSFFEDYGIAKPAIAHWEQQEGETLEEFLDTMEHRCSEDVKINTALWEDHMARLVDMYTTAQGLIDNGQEIKDKRGDVEKVINVGGTRISPDEWIPIDDMIGRTVDSAIDSILTFLMFKMDCACLQEKTRWELDVEHVRNSLEKLEEIVLAARTGLSEVMPVVPKYVKKTEPKIDPFKKNGERTAHWIKWDETMRKLEDGEKDPESGAPLVYIDPDDLPLEGKQVYRVWNKNEEPNPGSPVQVKDFLFSKGWVPQSFKYEKDEVAFNAWIASKPQGKANHQQWERWKNARPEERAIPQISVGGDDGKELCHSLIDLAEEVPAIKVYADYKVAENRRNVLLGFFRDMEDGKWLKARIGGFTNTLRVKHRELVNLPGVDKPYGYDIRGGLISGFKKILAGSDMSSLEDRVKHHFMLPHDPEYVKTMQADGFDPHILMALTAGMISQAEFEAFMADPKGSHPPHVKKGRKDGKTCNYASVYNAGAAKIAQAAGQSLATGEKLHKAYWELNWSVKAIAEEQVVFKDSRGDKWLINPINGFCYSLRKESDRFSTLAQGTGSYFFDMWVDNILNAMQAQFGRKTLTGSFHDECIICLGDSEKNRAAISQIITDAVEKVNKDFNLRRKLGCQTQFGRCYAEIH
ncbi:putative DNA polymerase [Pseudomonas phage vB_PsyM_KIL3b]|uniref:Putative DNA polymerase n=2 Tax=Pseudomonas phage vB_PsyM_KIL1 TaxID=1777065 RepID=A0A142IG14_9CAUD|nr:putative DNA polymerase [Pseudomonas phage vB_PsyM_KIL3]AMR58169.1 putative DNA polymerase [Pseudomonas phage vB_PsyM_KIL3b]